jgi:Flp pilus assembly pilin Flp
MSLYQFMDNNPGTTIIIVAFIAYAIVGVAEALSRAVRR